ncbi:MAG: ScyD/ScyE family protein [Chloroflexota bacterium]
MRVLGLCCIGIVALGLTVNFTVGQESSIEITPIAHNLNNPRGVAIMEDGQLLVVEAGMGSDTPDNVVGSGRILQLSDNNNDGDFDDEGERTVRLDAQPSYNSLAVFRTGHDEPFGLSDIMILGRDRVFFTLDNPFAEAGRNTGGEGYYGDVGIFVLNTQRIGATKVIARSATLNSFTYDPERGQFYVTESGYNRIMSADLDGNAEIIAELPMLAHGQQPVPAGITLDPTTGDLLIALFSGFVNDYYETQMGFFPGDARIMRLDPDTGILTDEITGLTTAIDVAVDEEGNIFVVELTTTWETRPMPYDFDLFDETQPPDPGGYARFTGRVTMYPADGEPIILADGLDAPTNVTYHDNALYISTALGTPNRSVLSHRGITQIEGILYKITGF